MSNVFTFEIVKEISTYLLYLYKDLKGFFCLKSTSKYFRNILKEVEEEEMKNVLLILRKDISERLSTIEKLFQKNSRISESIYLFNYLTKSFEGRFFLFNNQKLLQIVKNKLLEFKKDDPAFGEFLSII